MTKNYLETLTKDGLLIIKSIAIGLEEWVDGKECMNDNDPFSTGKIPNISLQDYMARLAGYINVWHDQCGGLETDGVRATLMTMIYISRIIVNTNGEYILCRDNVHRLVMIAFMMATKFEEDDCFGNKFWCQVAGVTLKEVNDMESAFCKLVEFRFFISRESYDTVVECAQELIEKLEVRK